MVEVVLRLFYAHADVKSVDTNHSLAGGAKFMVLWPEKCEPLFTNIRSIQY